MNCDYRHIITRYCATLRNVFLNSETCCYSLIGRLPANFTESVFPAFVSSVSSQGFFFPMQQQVGVEYTKDTSDKFQDICSTLWTRSIYSFVEWVSEWMNAYTIRKSPEHIQGGAKVGVEWFRWKIIQWLMNNNTRINSMFLVLTTVIYFHPTLYLLSVLCVPSIVLDTLGDAKIARPVVPIAYHPERWAL